MQANAGAARIPFKLHRYRVRIRGIARSVSNEFLFEKVIGCFKLHQRNLYDGPEFVLCDIARFGLCVDLLVQTRCKQLLLRRLGKLRLRHSSMRCRPFGSANWKSGNRFAPWLVEQYGLDCSEPGRRKVRSRQRRPVGNNYTYYVWNRTAHRQLLFGETEKAMMLQVLKTICSQMRSSSAVKKPTMRLTNIVPFSLNIFTSTI